jgi:hypothetical protein
MLLLFDENSLTEPERRSEQAYRPERWGQCAISNGWWTLKKERDNTYESS